MSAIGDLAPVGPVAAAHVRRAASVVGFLRVSRFNALAVALVALVLLAAIAGPLLAPYAPDEIVLLDRIKGPSIVHLFGTDDYGRDVFSRVLAGARISIQVAIIVLSLSVVLGSALGLVAGFFGGLVDEAIMRVTDLFLAFPVLILAAAIAATLGANLQTTMLALAAVYWPWYARLVRGQVLTLRERDFVHAARTFGAPPAWTIRKHLLPNVLPLIIVQVSLDIGYVILSTSSLSFLGLGAQPPTAEWGAMLTDARSYLRDAWWYAAFPGLALATTVFAFNLLGDALRDWLDPRIRRNR
jgi:peptide/nickel transport system permease protein